METLRQERISERILERDEDVPVPPQEVIVDVVKLDPQEQISEHNMEQNAACAMEYIVGVPIPQVITQVTERAAAMSSPRTSKKTIAKDNEERYTHVGRGISCGRGLGILQPLRGCQPDALRARVWWALLAIDTRALTWTLIVATFGSDGRSC